ncbi:MAG: YtxH domain-containing protein [Aestuariibacter sp.]|nr:YtxH domain-containing protein [Aestuariibacter sp.]
MRKWISFLIGALSGAMVGAAIAILLAPRSGQELQGQMRARVQGLIEEGRLAAAAARRAELEAQLDAFKRGAPVVVETVGKQPQV